MKFIPILFLFSFLCSCNVRVMDCTIVSTKNFDIDDTHRYKKLDKRIEGDDTTHMIIFIPIGLPNIKEAVDNTIEKEPGCVGLADAVLYSGGFYIPYIYGQFWYKIEATPIIEKKRK